MHSPCNYIGDNRRIGPTIDDVRLGTIRPSMKTNELLQPVEVEKPINRCRDLPGKGYTYGIRVQPSGGVAEALNGWASSTTTLSRSLSDTTQKRVHKDFINMNRSAVCLGLASSRENALFRIGHPMLLPDRPPPDQHRKKPQSYYPPDVTFGRRNPLRPPMFDIMQQKFRRDYIENQWLNTAKDGTLYERERMVIGKVMLPKKPSSKGPTATPSGEFGSTEGIPAISTFRSEEARAKALARAYDTKEETLRISKDQRTAMDIYLALRASLPHRQKMADIHRSEVHTKIYSPYSCHPLTGRRRCQYGDDCLTLELPSKDEENYVPPWRN